MPNPSNIKREAFFIPAEKRRLFSLYYHPIPNSSLSGDILYVHPFADEMNKSRRMAALQAQAFARAGFGVLQVDLFGCGDSSGEFSYATWEEWKDNISRAVQWLAEKRKNTISLWGLRLGTLLIMDWSKENVFPIDRFIFWQPVLSGAIAMNHFFRLASASQMLGKGGSSAKDTREQLGQGKCVEVGGYRLNPGLVQAIEAVKMEDLVPIEGSHIIWKEISLNDPPELSPVSRNLISVFEGKGCRVDAQPITGNSFWNSVEISVVSDLITATTASVQQDQSWD